MVTEIKIKAIDEKIRTFQEKYHPSDSLVYVIDGMGTRYNYHTRWELREKIATALESSTYTSLETLIKKDTLHKLRVVAFEKVHHPTQNLYIPGHVREELPLNPAYKVDTTPVEGTLDADKIERYFEQKGWKREFGYLRKHVGNDVLRIVPSVMSFRIEIGFKHSDGKMVWKHNGGGYYKDFYINEKGMLTKRAVKKSG